MDTIKQFDSSPENMQSKINALELKVNYLIGEIELLRRYMFGNTMQTIALDSAPTLQQAQNTPAVAIPETAAPEPDKPKEPLTFEEFIKTPIQTTPVNISSIVATIQPMHFVKVAQSTLYNIAQEFIHMHNKGNATVAELRQISRLSTAGIAKQLVRLKELGFVVKTAPRRYSLTEQAQQLLHKCLGGV